MELLYNGFTLDTPPGTFPLSTDSMVLSDFVRLPKNASVLDLGSGCGTLGLLLCAKDPTCKVTGVELDPVAHQAALKNIDRNQLTRRLSSICTDLRSLSSEVSSGSYTTCVSNPPYFSGGYQSSVLPLARQNNCCCTEDLFGAATRALQYGGDFFLVHKPEMLAQLMACAVSSKLEPKRLCLLRHHPEANVSLVLLQCRKGAKPGLIFDEQYLYEKDGTPSRHFNRIYHQEA